MIAILIVALSLGIPITMGLVLGAIMVGFVERDASTAIPYRRALLGLIGVVACVLILTGCPCDDLEPAAETEDESEDSSEIKFDVLELPDPTACPPACEPQT